LQRLFEACGHVDSFKRLRDPKTNIYKTFGFIEYRSAESALSALRVLQSLRIEGSRMELKVDKKTETFLEEYKKRKLDFWAKERRGIDIADPEMVKEIVEITDLDRETLLHSETVTDNNARETIHRILEERKMGNITLSEELAVNNTVEKLAATGVSEEETESKRLIIADQIRKFRQFEKSREKEKVEREKQKQAEQERERQRQMQKQAEREREKQRQKEIDDERSRRRKEHDSRRDYYDRHKNHSHRYSDSDSDGEHRRHRHSRSDRASKRSRRSYENDDKNSGRSDEREERDELKSAPQEKNSPPPPPPPQQSPYIIQPQQPPPPPPPVVDQILPPPLPTIKLNIKKSVPSSTVHDVKPHTQNTMTFLIDDEEEEEEEQRPVVRKSSTLDTILAIQEESKKEEEERLRKEEEIRKRMADLESKKKDNDIMLDPKQLKRSIPKKKDELLVYEVSWDVVDQYNLVPRIKSYLAKKIRDTLGDEEPTMIEFVLTKMELHTTPREIIDELSDVLGDDDATRLVLKVWRKFLLLIEKSKREISVHGKILDK